MAIKQCEHCGKPVMIPDAPALPANLDNMCRTFPALCGLVKSQGEQLNLIAKNMVRRDEHIAPNESVIKGWLDCPNCKPKFEALLKEHPELFTPEKPKAKKKQFAWER
jgi:hypothetical protein